MFTRILIRAINLYQRFISPFLGNSCRFYPSCSEYSKTALIRYGFIKGSLLSIIRLLKCNPFHPGGFDPLPDKE